MTRNEYAAHAALVATARQSSTFNTSGNAARATLEAYKARKASRSNGQPPRGAA